MECSISEVLDIKNHGRLFMCLDNYCEVANVNGCLFYAHKVSYIASKRPGGIVHLKRTKRKIKWRVAPATLFWLNAKYQALDINYDPAEFA